MDATQVSPELLVTSHPELDFGIGLRLKHHYPDGYAMSIDEAKRLRDALIRAVDHWLFERMTNAENTLSQVVVDAE